MWKWEKSLNKNIGKEAVGNTFGEVIISWEDKKNGSCSVNINNKAESVLEMWEMMSENTKSHEGLCLLRREEILAGTKEIRDHQHCNVPFLWQHLDSGLLLI